WGTAAAPRPHSTMISRSLSFLSRSHSKKTLVEERPAPSGDNATDQPGEPPRMRRKSDEGSRRSLLARSSSRKLKEAKPSVHDELRAKSIARKAERDARYAEEQRRRAAEPSETESSLTDTLEQPTPRALTARSLQAS